MSVGISVRSHIELPYYAKYLLIASYLASYNPAHTDRRFFTKQGRRGLSNRAKAAAKAKKSNTQLTGRKIKIKVALLFNNRISLRWHADVLRLVTCSYPRKERVTSLRTSE